MADNPNYYERRLFPGIDEVVAKERSNKRYKRQGRKNYGDSSWKAGAGKARKQWMAGKNSRRAENKTP